jgi:hypothetical protein
MTIGMCMAVPGGPQQTNEIKDIRPSFGGVTPLESPQLFETLPKPHIIIVDPAGIATLFASLSAARDFLRGGA